jgi:glutamate dehydrogenase/leucine dehydrogenase
MKPIKEIVEGYRQSQPEIVHEWTDEETGAHGWLVINSLRGGAAGGGTRMRKGANKDEVLSLAKTMEIKFTVAGPDIGGAKSGINFDPSDSRKAEVLKRWYSDISPRLKSYYGTGGDMNVTDQEVIEYTKPYVGDPQEGIVVGRKSINVEKIIEQLQSGVSLRLGGEQKYTPTYKINDMVTGYGVIESIRHYYDFFASNESLSGKRAIIQGWGNVGAAAGFFLTKNGAKVVAISDSEGSLINDEGFSMEEIIDLFNSSVSTKTIKHENKTKSQDAVFDVKADIFAPCAGSFVNKEHVDKLIAGGIKVVACGANVPFVDQGGGNIYSDITSYADENLSVIPDFIANCGMAHTFAYLMKDNISVDEEGIFNSVSNTIREALSEIKEAFGESNSSLTEKAIRIALKKLGHE